MIVDCPWSEWNCNCDNGKRSRKRKISQEDSDRGAKCKDYQNYREITDCDIGSCSCRVVSKHCFPLPDPINSDYGDVGDNQCRADTKDCEIQPDQRSDEKTRAACDETLCFDIFGCKLHFKATLITYQLNC